MYVIVWRFVVKDEHRAEFERHYGPAGTWAELFRRDPAFVRTELFRGDRNEYVTRDYWKSKEAFLAFRSRNLAEYETIDRGFEALTESETHVGDIDTEKDRAGVIAPPPLIFATFWALGWLGRGLLRVEVPQGVPIGAVLCVVAIVFGLAAAWELHRFRTTIDPYGSTTAIVSSGPFRLTRNPLYVSLALFYGGLALIAHALTAILLLPVALIVLTFGVIRREERYLERKFGVQYCEYRGRVRRWL